jgi:hypothetical protein
MSTGFVQETSNKPTEADRALLLFNEIHSKTPLREIKITVGECTIEVSGN